MHASRADSVIAPRACRGVTRVSLSTRIPVQGGGSTTTVVEGYEPASGTGSVELNWAAVSTDYFATLGIDLVEGRGYTEDDRFSDLRTIVVNEMAARRFWPGQGSPPPRAAGREPSLPSVELTTAEGHLCAPWPCPASRHPCSESFRSWPCCWSAWASTRSFRSRWLDAFRRSGSALHWAPRAPVVRLVVGEVAGTVAVGLALGGALVVAVGLRFGSALYGVSVLDPVTVLASILVLGGVVGLASYLPARRAARVDPVNAIRG